MGCFDLAWSWGRTRRKKDRQVQNTRHEREDENTSTDACKLASLERGIPSAPTQVAPSTQIQYGGTQVLQCVQLQRCDILYADPAFLEPGVAAFLHSTTAVSKDSNEFLERLMGTEKAQAAVSAVLQGQPYKTVLQAEAPAGGAALQSKCRSPAPSQRLSLEQLPCTVLATQQSFRATLPAHANSPAAQLAGAQNGQGLPCEDVCLGRQVQQDLELTRLQQLAEEADTGATGGAVAARGAGGARSAGGARAGRDAVHAGAAGGTRDEGGAGAARDAGGARGAGFTLLAGDAASAAGGSTDTGDAGAVKDAGDTVATRDASGTGAARDAGDTIGAKGGSRDVGGAARDASGALAATGARETRGAGAARDAGDPVARGGIRGAGGAGAGRDASNAGARAGVRDAGGAGAVRDAGGARAATGARDAGGAGAARDAGDAGAAGGTRDAGGARSTSNTSINSAQQLRKFLGGPPSFGRGGSLPLPDDFLLSAWSKSPVQGGVPSTSSACSVHAQHASSSKAGAKSGTCSSSTCDLNRAQAGTAHTQHASSSKVAPKSGTCSSSTGDHSGPMSSADTSCFAAPVRHQSSLSSLSSLFKGPTAECVFQIQAGAAQDKQPPNFLHEGHSRTCPTNSPIRTSPFLLHADTAVPADARNQARFSGSGSDFGAGAADKMVKTSGLKALNLSDAALRRMRDLKSQSSSGACDRTLVMLGALSKAASEELMICKGESSGDMGAKSRRGAPAQTAHCISRAGSCPLEAMEASQEIRIGGDGEELQEGLQRQQQQQQQQPLTPVRGKRASQSTASNDLKWQYSAKGTEPASGVSPLSGCQGLQQILEEQTNCSGQHLAHGAGDLERSAHGKAFADPPSPPMDTTQKCFEVAFSPLKPERGRQPLAMMSITDISESLQVQAALMSLAEGQLLLLASLLPQHAIEFLACHSCTTSAPIGMPSLARCHHQVTLLFLDIVGFTSMAKMVEPQSVMLLLNNLFSTFDHLTDQFGIHKVETAGDCYIVSAGVLSADAPNGFHSILETHDHVASAKQVMEFAKAVLRESAKVAMPHSGSPVEVRIGIHTGEVMSGIIGSKLPKFSLFGDCMVIASRMESSGKPGRIQVSETTHALLPEYAWEPREIMVKGKGAMKAYLWDDSKNGGWNQSALPNQTCSFTFPLPEAQPKVSSSGKPQGLSKSSPLLRLTAGRPSISEQSNLFLALRAMETLVSMN